MNKRAYHNSNHPISGFVSEGFCGIEEKDHHYGNERQRVDVGRDAQRCAVQKTEHAECPNDTEDGCHLHDVLF